MLNSIKADFYRLFHSKGFYITQGLLLLLVVTSVTGEALGSIGVTGQQSLQSDALEAVWTGRVTIEAMSSMASFLLYFCLPLFVITIGFDLTKKTYKNLLTAGVSRRGFFVSKYIVFVLMSLMQFVIYYGAAFVTACIKNGAGSINGEFIGNFFRVFGLQFVFFQAIFGLAVVAMNLVRSNVASVLAVIIFPIVVSMLAMLLKNADWLQYLNFQGNIDSAWVQGAPDGYWVKAVMASLASILVCLGLGYSAFQKQDL